VPVTRPDDVETTARGAAMLAALADLAAAPDRLAGVCVKLLIAPDEESDAASIEEKATARLADAGNLGEFAICGEPTDLPAALTEKLGDDDLAQRVAANFSDYQALAERDARNIERLTKELRTKSVIRVPYLDEDVHDLAGLAQINRYLFATGEERVAMAAGRA